MKPNLDTLFAPSSVAIIGASSNPNRLTGRPLRILRRHGFRGDIHVIHPRESEIDGVPTHRSLEELPIAPDVLLVMLRAELVPDLAERAGVLGVKHLVILSSGFEETTEGAVLSDSLRDIAARYGMGIVGPNSEGFWYPPAQSILTFGSAAQRDDLVAGPVAVLSQSGSIGASVMRSLNDAGVGAELFVSVGNETVLGVADYISWIVEHGTVKVIVCFLEGLRDGRAFLEAAAAARAAGISVVVLKAGSSEEGRAASASHTGKISTGAAIYDALFAQVGVVTVESIEQLALAAATLSRGTIRASEQSGRGLTVIGLSGGSRSIIADTASDLGIPLATLSKETTDGLAEFIPAFGVTTNPVDPTGQVISDAELFPRTIRMLATDPNSEALIIQYANGGTHLLAKHLPALQEASLTHGLPVIVSSLLDQLSADDPLRRQLAEAGVAYVSDPVAAVRAVAPLFAAASESLPRELLPTAKTRPNDPIRTWQDAVGLLSQAGVGTPREVVVPASTSAAELALRLDEAGLHPPMVVKPSPDEVLHKSELGLVFLRIATADEAADALARVAESLGENTRVVVQEMVAAEAEILVVLQQDPDFGSVLGVGLGGFFIELIGEMTYVSLPATREQIARGIESTRVGRLLAGYRGGAAVDKERVIDSLLRLGQAYAELENPPDIIELNPILIRQSGAMVAIDSLVE